MKSPPFNDGNKIAEMETLIFKASRGRRGVWRGKESRDTERWVVG